MQDNGPIAQSEPFTDDCPKIGSILDKKSRCLVNPDVCGINTVPCEGLILVCRLFHGRQSIRDPRGPAHSSNFGWGPTVTWNYEDNL